MKRSFAIVALLVLLGFSASMAAAQTAGNSPTASENLYIKIMYIAKVYPHTLGYKVNYWTGDGKIATTYLPISWFSGTAAKGEIYAQWGPSVPYMEIVYSNDKFKYVRLHVSPSFSDLSWGSLPQNEDPTEQFKVDTLVMQY